MKTSQKLAQKWQLQPITTSCTKDYKGHSFTHAYQLHGTAEYFLLNNLKFYLLLWNSQTLVHLQTLCQAPQVCAEKTRRNILRMRKRRRIVIMYILMIIIIIMKICKVPTLRLKALNKHTHIMYIEMENVIQKRRRKKCIYWQVFKHNYAKDAHTWQMLLAGSLNM